MKVMVVEDKGSLREVLKNLLEDDGFEIIGLENGLNLMGGLRVNCPDLLLLDQILPGQSDLEAVRDLRASAEYRGLPIIMVTGLLAEEDRVNAFELGADDYVTKPFFPKELAARIKALARRTRTSKTAPELKPGAERIVNSSLVVDLASYRVTVESREISLTLTEFKILAQLLRHSGQVLTRGKLRESALGNLNVTDRTIDVHMASLRKKLGPVGPQVETVRGVGYRFRQHQVQSV